MKIKNALSFLAIFFLSFMFYAKNIYGSQQLIYSDDWVLEALEQVFSEQKISPLINSAPLTVAEIKLQLEKIDFEKLSSWSKNLYAEISGYLDSKDGIFDTKPVKFSFNISASPEILYKSNSDIDWTFATDYTKGGDYGAASNYNGNRDVKKLVSVPIYLDFSDIFFIETEPYFSKNFWAFSENENLTNVMFSPNQMEFLFPSNAYLSAGKSFDAWGFNFFIAKEGVSIGRSQTGNVLYNSTFQTDAVFQMSLYSKNVKYNLNVAEVDISKFMYIHYIDISLFKWLRLGILEGTLVNDSFSLKYLNPLMIMHSFGSWNEYCSEEEKKHYNEANVCAYFGFDFDISPCKYFRFYGAYAQNEIQSFLELSDDIENTGNYYPDSYAFQLGAELNIPDSSGGNWKASLEGVYSSPYCYVKQGAEWSLYKARTDMNFGKNDKICSWIGTPFGPDSIAAQAKLSYSRRKWNAGLEYLFVAHGENSFGLFSDKDEEGWYKYYPSAQWLQKDENLTEEEKNALAAELKKKARNLLPSGIVSYTNRITCRGFYRINRHFCFDSALSYSFIFNNRNKQGSFAQGIELEASGTWTLF